jgi:isopentenyl phosphate kinase
MRPKSFCEKFPPKFGKIKGDKMENLILIKLGGSLITNKNKPFTENLGTIKRLAKEIHQARQQVKTKVIIGHGGGSYPHVPATKYRTAEGTVNQESFRGIAEVQDAAARLNRVVIRECLAIGENAISIHPSSCMIARSGEIREGFLGPLIKLLEFQMLPVVYGDVVLDENRGCCILSTERILNFLAFSLQEEDFRILRIIHCGTTDGVYGSKGRTISKIKSKDFAAVKKYLGVSEGIDVTGGMLHKVKECLEIANLGITSLIVNGKDLGNLEKAIFGAETKGTIISP